MRTEKWPSYLLKKQKLELKWPGTRALSKGHQDQGAQARAHRRGARCSMPLTPKVSNPGRLQSSQMLRSSQREGSRARRGRQRRQSNSQERQEQVTPGERGRSQSNLRLQYLPDHARRQRGEGPQPCQVREKAFQGSIYVNSGALK